MRSVHWNLALGLIFTAFALLTLLVWIPNDIETGIVEKVRRRVEVGDAMFPVVVATALLVVSALLAVTSAWDMRRGEAEDNDGRLTLANGRHLIWLIAVVAISLALMVWTGPVVVAAFNAVGADLGSYRELRDTAPYKYLGFVLGGLFLVVGLISAIEGRPGLKAAITAAGTVAALILLYDLPFDDLLLPPNGDQ